VDILHVTRRSDRPDHRDNRCELICGALIRCLRKIKDIYCVIATRRKIWKIRGLEGLGAETTTDNVEAATEKCFNIEYN
jgi:hypothetical protein